MKLIHMKEKPLMANYSWHGTEVGDNIEEFYVTSPQYFPLINVVIRLTTCGISRL